MQSKRLSWIDSGRGFCGIGVVLYHLSDWLATISPNTVLLQDIAIALAPLRMPLFFLISGLLAQSIHLASPEKWRVRILGLLALYLFWSALFFSRVPLIATIRNAQPPSIEQFLMAIVIPSIFWFILCLPVFYIVIIVYKRTFGTRYMPLLIFATVLAISSDWIDERTQHLVAPAFGQAQVGPMSFNFIWFVLGTYFGDQYKKLVLDATPIRLIGTLLLAGLLTALTWNTSYATLRLIMAAAFLVLFANILGLLDPRTRMMRTLDFVGHYTLPLYIFHIILVAIVGGAIRNNEQAVEVLRSNALLANSAILFGTIGCTVVSVWLGKQLSNSRFAWLIVPRDWARSR